MLNDKILSAATSGDTSELKVLLGTATDPNVKDPFGLDSFDVGRFDGFPRSGKIACAEWR